MGKVNERVLEAVIAELGLTGEDADKLRKANEPEDTSEPTNEELEAAAAAQDNDEPPAKREKKPRRSRGDGPPGQKSVSSDF